MRRELLYQIFLSVFLHSVTNLFSRCSIVCEMYSTLLPLSGESQAAQCIQYVSHTIFCVISQVDSILFSESSCLGM